jgi:metallophosphoesterase (TIGR00282 family)
MRILFLGDVVGKAGRLAVKQFLPKLKEELRLDAVLANGENAAGGIGMTCETMDELFAAGVDFITAGNHVWRHKEIFSRLEKDRRIIRPANYPEGTPGRGHAILTLRDGRRIAVLNMLGTTYMEPLPCPFRTALSWVDSPELEEVPVRLVDFHAEATSEKKTMGWALDGKVSAVLGTHTHVQTADAQILPHGTAYLTDLGMCGVEQSSLGMDFEIVFQRFLTKLPAAFKPAKGDISLNGAYLDINDITGRAREIRIIRENCPAWKIEKAAVQDEDIL